MEDALAVFVLCRVLGEVDVRLEDGILLAQVVKCGTSPDVDRINDVFEYLRLASYRTAGRKQDIARM